MLINAVSPSSSFSIHFLNPLEDPADFTHTVANLLTTYEYLGTFKAEPLSFDVSDLSNFPGVSAAAIAWWVRPCPTTEEMPWHIRETAVRRRLYDELLNLPNYPTPLTDLIADSPENQEVILVQDLNGLRYYAYTDEENPDV